jgi:phage-related protein
VSDYGALTIVVDANTGPMTVQIKQAATKAGAEAGAAVSEHMSKGLGSKLGSAAGAVGKSVATGLGLATTAAVAFGIHAFKAASQITGMQASLGALAKANGVSLAAMNQNIDAMRRQGVAYGDAQKTVGDLVRDHIGLSHATELSRIAQNAAAVTGRSYSSVEDALTRAIATGNAGMLRRSGIIVDSASAEKAWAAAHNTTVAAMTTEQKSMVTLNAVMAAGGHVAGAYAAQLKTPQGAMHLMKISAEELTIGIGTSLVHALSPAFTGFAKLGLAIQDATAPGGKLAPILGAIQIVVGKLAAPLGHVITLFSGWLNHLDPAKVKSFASEIVKIGPALAGAGAAAALFTGAGLLQKIPMLSGLFGPLASHIDQFGKALMNLSGPWKFVIGGFVLLMAVSPPFRKEVMLIVTTLIKGLAPAFVQMGKSLLMLVPVFVALAKVAGPVLAVALSALMPLVYALTDVIKFLAPALGPIVIGILAIVAAVKVWTAIQAILDLELSPFTLVLIGIIAVIAGLSLAVYEVVKHWHVFETAFLGVFRSVLGWLKANWPLVIGIILGPVGIVAVLVIKHWTEVRAFTEQTWRAITTFVTRIVGDLVAFLSGAWDDIKRAVQAAWRWLLTATTTAWRTWGSIVRGAVSAVVGIVSDGFNAIRSAIGGALSRATSTIRGWGSSLLGAGRSAVSNLLAGITSALAGIGGWVKAHVVDPIVGAVKHWFGIASPSTVMRGLGESVTEGFVSGIVKGNPVAVAKHVFGGIPSALAAIVGKGIVGVGSLPSKALSALGSVGGWARGMLTKVGGLFGHLFGGGSSGTSQWGGLMMAVLKHFGIPSLYGTFMAQMATESGGNPRAINLWDSNAQAGIPSQGLMQVIPPTFAAYAGPYRSRGIMDPLANIYAAVAYALSRYGGSIGAVLGHGHGYAAGGILREPVAGFGLHSGTPYSFGENAPRIPERWSPLTGAGADVGHAQAVVINVYPQQGQSEVEIAAAVSRRLDWAAATGRA